MHGYAAPVAEYNYLTPSLDYMKAAGFGFCEYPIE